MIKKQIKPQHLKDIDFRKREVRQVAALQDFLGWYDDLSSRPYSDLIQGQLSMLSAVLWYLMPEKEYKRLITTKKGITSDVAIPVTML